LIKPNAEYSSFQEYNRLISDVAKPFAFVLIIVGITSAFAGNCGAAINPVQTKY